MANEFEALVFTNDNCVGCNKCISAFYNIHEIQERVKKDTKKSPWSRPLTPEKRLAALNKQFKDLRLEDYLRKYTDRSRQCAHKIPTEAQLNAVFNDMNKTTAESRRINCSCCGYATCKDMATAIFNGFNHSSNCVHYLKDLVETEKKEAQLMVEHERAELDRQKQSILDAIATINEHFISVNATMHEISTGKQAMPRKAPRSPMICPMSMSSATR